MSPHMFGVVRRSHIPAAVVKRLDAVAGEHGATFGVIRCADGSHMGWFEAPNRGAPFDGDTEREVLAAVDAAGLSGALRAAR